MSTPGTEKYSRILLTIIKGGTKLTRRLCEKRVKDLSENGEEDTIDDFLSKNKSVILEKKSGKNKKNIYFPSSGKTNLEEWDLGMFCYILEEACDLSPTAKMYVQKLQKIRNKLCHSNDPTLEPEKFQDLIDKIKCSFEHCLREINDEEFKKEMKTLIKSFATGPLSLDDTLKAMHTFYRLEWEQKEILEKIGKGQDSTHEKLDRNFEMLERIDSRLPSGDSVDIQSSIVIEVRNCSAEKEKEVLDILVKNFNEAINKTESSLEKELPNGALHTLRETVTQVFKEFLNMGRNIISVQQKCLLLTVKCTSIKSFVNLIRDYRTDALSMQLSEIERVIKTLQGCEDVQLENLIFKEEFLTVMDDLVSKLDEQVQPTEYAILPYMSQSSMQVGANHPRTNGIGTMHLSEQSNQHTSATTENSIRITFKYATISQMEKVQQIFNTGTFGNGMKRIETQVGQELNVQNMSLTTKLIKEDGAMNVDIPDKTDIDNLTKDEDQTSRVEDVEQTKLRRHGLDCATGSLLKVEKIGKEVVKDVYKEQQSSMKQETENLLIEKYVPSKSIDELIEDSRIEMIRGNTKDAVDIAKKTTVLIDEIKDISLTKKESPVLEEHLSDWYGECYSILYSLRQIDKATMCYYKANVFDPEWDYDGHLSVSEMLWENLVFFKLITPYDEVSKHVDVLLRELDGLARYAEARKKWSLCVAIDGDIEAVYHFLEMLILFKIKPLDTSRKQERIHILKRMSRCYLKMGLHQDAIKSCTKIAQELGGNGDTETFETLKQSLTQTNNYEMAAKECSLAFRYYMNDAKSEKQLQILQNDIEKKRKLPDESWLEGTHAVCLHTSSKIQPHEIHKKNKHKRRRPKAKDRQGNDSLSIQRDSKNSELDVTNEGSNEHLTNDAAVGSPEKSLSTKHEVDKEMSESAQESDYEFSETSRFDDSDEEDVSNSTLETSEDKRSFYEKSLDSQYRDTDMERYLQKGVYLSDNYLKQFKLNRPTSDHKSFYPKLLDESSLRKLIRDSPEKYVTGVIYFDSTHEAHCKPLDSAKNISIIEISGRSKIGFEVFNEDEVVVEILDNFESKEKRYGKVCGILQRRRQRNIKHPVFLCTLDETEGHLVKPLCRTVPKLHILTEEIKKTYKTKREKQNKLEIYQYDEIHECLKNPRIIDIVPTEKQSYILAVAYIKWGTKQFFPRGAVIEILPTVRNKNTGLTILNLQYGIPGVYDSGTLKDTGKCIQRYEKELENISKGRLNLTKNNTFSVNESNVVDVNYAFSIEEVENGYKIGVHVSDVSEFVKKDSDLDKEACRRSTTFDSGISKLSHMLPEPLSEDICSLLPGKIRPTISLFLFISNEGTPMQREEKDYDVCLSFIKSSHKLSYEDVDRLLSSGDCDDELTKDVCKLVNISLRMKANREKYPTDASSIAYDEAFGFRQSGSEWTKANIMTDEILDMANKKITLYLQGKYGDCLPVMYTKPSSNEAVQAFLRNTDNTLDLVCKLQNKRIGTKVPKYSTCDDKRSSVILSRNVWDTIKELPKMARDYIQNDDLHPFQRILYSKLQSILNTVEFKPCGSLKEVKPKPLKSTRFTSPISSFIDMIVIRQLHSALLHGENPYSMKEIKGICMYANSMRSKEKEYKQACKILAEATDLQNNPMMILAVVSKVSNKSIHLLTHISKKELELPFSLLDVAEKPIVIQDTKTKFDKVKVTWKKRLYNINIDKKKENEKGFDLAINPYSDVVFMPLHEWTKMLKLSKEGNEEALSREIKGAKVIDKSEGYDDVTTECIDSLELKPDTKFSMTFSLGQIVRVQITAEHLRGMLNPTLMLYNMTNNVKFCLQHQHDPVNNLYEYALHASCQQYEDVEEYLNIWEPILLMESSIGAVKNEENFCIKDVPVKFNGRKGSFALGLAECESRNIEFSGTLSDDDENDDNEEDTAGKPCYDWLCIKTTVQNNNLRSQNVTDSVWVGHAKIEEVRRKKVSSSAKITVMFSLHKKAPSKPKSIRTVDTKYSVEVLRKMEVDRRSESFIKMLRHEKETLATKIALKKAIPPLDESRESIARQITHDLFYEASNEDLLQKPMPKNNEKQEEAIKKALTSKFSLIQGPPGTGKSITGIKLIYLFDKINEKIHREKKPRKQVLFCGPSNKSVDLIAVWMLKRMGNHRPNFVRVYGRSIETIDFPVPGRTFQSKKSTRAQRTSPGLYQIALHHLIREKGKKHADEINKFDKMFKDANYKPMPLQVKKYVHLIREASIEEIRKHDVILCTTAVGSNPKVLSAASVYQVIIDEAGMCPEPHCLVPIIATKAEQVVLIGDHKQLKPIVMCKEAASLGLEISLFERYALSVSRDSSNVEFTMLEEQYRMDPKLSEFPSSEFYQNRLKNGNDGIRCCSNLTFWPKDGSEIYPMVFVHVEGQEEILPVSTEDGNEQSRSNAAEVDLVVNAYKYLKKDEHKVSIKILSQYNAQCSEIKKKLENESFADVGTVVSSQGGEWDYVIFSTVRSLPDYKIEINPTIGWCQHNLGFITDRNQINVALTRAKKGLIIIGNKNLLQCDAVWKKMIQHYENHGCVFEPDKFEPTAVCKRQMENISQEYQNKITHIGSGVRGTRSRREMNY